MKKLQNEIIKMSKSELLDTLHLVINSYSKYSDETDETDANLFSDADENTFFHNLVDTLMSFEMSLDERMIDVEDL